MLAHCVAVRDPFHPASTREIREVTDACTLADLAPATDAPFIILRNGDAVLRADWAHEVADGDLIAVVLLPQDGGGGGGSNPMRLILAMAVMYFAPQIGMLTYESAVGAAGITSAGATAAGIAGTLVGMALVNSLISPPKPPSTQQAAALAAPSPTYSLQAQGNTARLGAAIPVQYGRLDCYPDFAAQPYVEYAGNEQYLYQLLCIGQGAYSIEAIRIDSTPIMNFGGVQYEVVQPGGTVTLFPTNVISSTEVSGQELVGAMTGTYTQLGTTITVSVTGHGLTPGRTVYLDISSGGAASGAYLVQTAPDLNTYTVTAAVGLSLSGNVTQTTYLGAFNASSAAQNTANYLGVDVICPRGLYSYDTTSGAVNNKSLSFVVEAAPINSSGTPIGAWVTLDTPTLTAATTTPQRYSFRYSVPPGRYAVRLRRTDTRDTSSTVGHELDWTGLRAYLPQSGSFGNVTMVALRMQASNNLSLQASRKINVICTRLLPVWNGTSWSAPQATRSIAWALADACRNTDYGASMADARMDLAGLLALDATWAARGDTFDGRFDSALTLWEALSKIAQAGRGRTFMQGGIVRCYRDQAASVPVALFSMRNILRGSFSIDYLMPTPDTADAIDVTYFDADTWAPATVTASLPGSAASVHAKIDLTVGVTSRDQAYREGLYQAAANKYRRRIIKFATEMEGFIPSMGDLIAIQHDMPAWGQFAEVVAWDATNRVATLSEPMTWQAGATHYIGLRKRDGSVDGPYQVTQGVDAYRVVLSTTPAITPYTGGSEERTHVTFGRAETWRQLARVISVTPRGLYAVEVQAVNEDANVHTADQGVTTPLAVTSQLTTLYTTPVVAGLVLRSSASDNSKALMSWQAAPGADHYVIECAPSATSTTWTRVGETTASNYAVTAIYGASTWFRLAAVGAARGPWVLAMFGATADYFWTSDTTSMWTGDSNLMWSY